MDIRALRNIIDRPASQKGAALGQSRNNETSTAVFALVFSEVVKHCQSLSSDVQGFERRLAELGRDVGLRLHLLIWLNDKNAKRETCLLNALYYVHQSFYKAAFGMAADSLERSNQNQGEFMIVDNNPLVAKYVSCPRDLGALNVSAFIAGMLEAVLSAIQFPATVSAHLQPVDGMPNRTKFLLTFSQDILDREANI